MTEAIRSAIAQELDDIKTECVCAGAHTGNPCKKCEQGIRNRAITEAQERIRRGE